MAAPAQRCYFLCTESLAALGEQRRGSHNQLLLMHYLPCALYFFIPAAVRGSRESTGHHQAVDPQVCSRGQEQAIR